MKNTHFVISDFCISTIDIPVNVADKILLYHVIPLNAVQDCCPFKVSVSLNSGYRPYVWEIARGRDGNSEHTFGQRKVSSFIDKKGAVDITCDDFHLNKGALLDILIEKTDYLRFAVYNTFIHADYKDLDNGKKRLFIPNSKGKWIFNKNLT